MRPLDWALLVGLLLCLAWIAVLRTELRHLDWALRVHVENRHRHSGPDDEGSIRR